MFGSWFEAVMLAVEANGVIGLRMVALAKGGPGAHDEARRMVSEKVDAAFEAAATIMAGGTTATVIGRYREHVAANAVRLAPTSS